MTCFVLKEAIQKLGLKIFRHPKKPIPIFNYNKQISFTWNSLTEDLVACSGDNLPTNYHQWLEDPISEILQTILIVGDRREKVREEMERLNA